MFPRPFLVFDTPAKTTHKTPMNRWISLYLSAGFSTTLGLGMTGQPHWTLSDFVLTSALSFCAWPGLIAYSAGHFIRWRLDQQRPGPGEAEGNGGAAAVRKPDLTKLTIEDIILGC